MPLTPLSGTLGLKRAAHLLRRATFGATKQQIDEFANYTAAQAVTQLFNDNIPDAPLPVDDATGESWVTPGAQTDTEDSTLQGYFKSWLLGQILSTGVADNLRLAYSLREKITFFMHTFFTTKQQKVNDSRALYFQNALFRLFAFDRDDRTVQITDPDTQQITDRVVPMNFNTLTKKISVDNAMLIFLDGNLNVSGNPNENYGRELLELFSIGRGLEGTLPPATGPGDYFNYTEADVQAAANVLTGYDNDNTYAIIDQETDLPRGIINVNSHETDTALKTFSTRFEGAIIDADPALLQGGQPTEESVLDELSQLIDLIYTKEETAKYVCRKLYRYFSHYDITEDLDNSIIANLAATFTANNFKLQPVLEDLFQSEHFYEAVAGVEDDKFGGIIKSPLDLAAGALGFFQVDLPDYETDLTNFYASAGSILGNMENQGMDLYEPFEVAGYSAYHQYPVFNRNWISTNWLTNRYNFIRALLGDMESGYHIDSLSFVQTVFPTEASNARQLIISLATYLYPMADNLSFDVDGGDLTQERLRYFLQAFLGFTSQDEADQAVADWASLYADAANYLEVTTRLDVLLNSMLQTPEYQLF